MTDLVVCKMCLRADLPLHRSHIIPAWAYRRATNTEREGNPNPVWEINGKFIQTSEQVTDRLLCEPCEQRLGVHERAVARLAATRDFVSPLAGSMPKRFATLGELEEDVAAHFLQFSCSVFWRAHVSKVRACKKFVLPTHVADYIRLYLTGYSRPPKAFPICMTVLDHAESPNPLTTLVTFPHYWIDDKQWFRARFVVTGFAFDLIDGPGLPESVFTVSLSHGKKPWVSIRPWTDFPSLRNTAETFARGTLTSKKRRQRNPSTNGV